MEYQLIVPNIPLEKQLTAVEQVLANRGIVPANVEHYLHTTDKDILDPKGIMNMQSGVKMLIKFKVMDGHNAADVDQILQLVLKILLHDFSIQ